MKSKAPLLLMEQMVMLLVFALAAALCLQVFAKSGEDSRRAETRDRAVVLVQTAAETIRHCGGAAPEALSKAAEQLDLRLEGAVWQTDCGEDWESGTYRLTAQEVPSDVPGLEAVRVAVEDAGGTALFAVEVTWQGEVDSHG